MAVSKEELLLHNLSFLLTYQGKESFFSVTFYFEILSIVNTLFW